MEGFFFCEKPRGWLFSLGVFCRLFVTTVWAIYIVAPGEVAPGEVPW
jgi:hypothetical protein